MPTDAHNAQDYTANGPTDIGFRTGGDGKGITNGVVAIGTQCGVHGEGGPIVGSAAVPVGVFGHSKDGVGVRGVADRGGAAVEGFASGGPGVNASSISGNGLKGDSTENDGVVGTSSGERKSGVFGDHTRTKGPASGVTGRCESPQGAGVFGFSDSGGNGVKGFSSGNDAVVGVANAEFKSGVFGDNSQEHLPASGVSGRSVSPQGAGVFGFSDVGAIGVKGFSAANDGIVGESKAALKSGVFGLNTELTGAAFGVSGSCDSPDGAGVNGFSNHGGIGVRGSSHTGTGGVFSSDNSAQINLVPKLDKLPRDGKAGDLLVINGPIDPGDPGLIGAILHVCLRTSDSQDPAMWGKVVFQIASD